MEILIFALVWGGCSLLCRLASSRTKEIRLASLQEAARLVIVGYSLFFLSAMPLVWANRWSPSHQLIVVLGLLVIGALVCAFRFTQGNLPDLKIGRISPARALLFLGALIVGIALQWRPIYYLYATHDPSAYLNASHELARSGHFYHQSDLLAEAYGNGNEKLKPLLMVDEKAVPDPWLLTRHFGITPTDLSKGQSSYHGLFGANLFLALGIRTLGSEHCLRIHWLHFAASLILIIAIVQLLLAVESRWAYGAGYLLALTPLIAPIFREPLSEPLAQVLFLGLAFTSLTSAGWLFLGCLFAALCTRVSALMYLPFAIVGFAVRPSKPRPSFWLAFIVLVGAALILVWRVSPNYVNEILIFYTAASKKVLGGKTALTLFSLLIVGAIVLRQRVRSSVQWVFSAKGWRTLLTGYLFLFGVGLLIRYTRLFTVLDYNYGGFPFIVFNLESMIFYAGPLVCLVGFYQLFKSFLGWNLKENFFVLTYVPFCLFFYLLFRFLAMTVQLNFQRYLIIELVPLAIIGFTAACATLAWQRQQKIARVLFVISLVWNGGILYFINHSSYAKDSHAVYSDLKKALEAVPSASKGAVIVAAAPTWEMISFLMPFTTGFASIPVLAAPHGFSYEESQAVQELERLGYTPLLVTGRAETPRTGTQTWKAWKATDHCYEYSAFDQAAPPIEPYRRCVSLNWWKKGRDPVPAVAGLARFAWRDEASALPLKTRHWLGLELNGSALCDGRYQYLEILLDFGAEEIYQNPVAKVNGRTLGQVFNLASPGPRGSQSHDVKVEIPLRTIPCSGTHFVDLFFPPVTSEAPARWATIRGIIFSTPGQSAVPFTANGNPASPTL